MSAAMNEARLSVLSALLNLDPWEASRLGVLVDSALRHREPAGLRLEAQRQLGSVRWSLERLASALEAEVFTEHMADQGPTRLEADRMEAWGESDG